MFTKDHGNLALACQITFSNLYKRIVRFAFTKSSRVHATQFQAQYSFYSTIIVRALTRLQSSRMWLVPGDQTRTAFLSFQFLSDTCYTKEREAKLTRKARCPPRHIPVEAILPVQLGRETRRSIDRVASSSYASTVFST